MTTELIPLENPQPGALFVPGGLDPILARIEADARALVPDISTVKGRSAIASLAAKVAKAKTYLDGIGKDYTADLKRQTGAVDAERKAMRDRLDALKAEVRRPLDEWEQEEEDRVAAIRRRIAVLNAPYLESHSSGFWSDVLAEVGSIDIDDSFAEFRDEAQAAKEACLYRLTQARDAAMHREAEAARVAAEAEAAQAKAQQEREERIAKEAAERATREAEMAAKMAQELADLRARDAEARARDAEARAMKEAAFAKARAERAVREEQERAAAAKRAQEEADANRAADQAHRERIHAEIEEDIRRAVVTDHFDLIAAIAAGRIRHLTINY